MTALSKLKPDWLLEAYYQIKADQLKEYNIKGIITDLDNTLIAWNQPASTHLAKSWVNHLKESDIDLVILSNNKEERIRPVANSLGVDFISRGLKPLPYKFKKAIDYLALPKDEILMVGDQLLTDIFGAKQVGLQSALVKPLVKTDGKITRFNRKIEGQLLRQMMSLDKKMKWRQSLSD